MKMRSKIVGIMMDYMLTFILIVVGVLPYSIAYLLIGNVSDSNTGTWNEMVFPAIYCITPLLLWWFTFAYSGKLLFSFTFNMYGGNIGNLFPNDVWEFNINGGSIAASFFGFIYLIMCYALNLNIMWHFMLGTLTIMAWIIVTGIQFIYFNKLVLR